MDSVDLESRVFRVVAIGDASVGKTAIITQLMHGRISGEEKSTVGAMFVLHHEVVDGGGIEMQVWDTAGQERFRSLGPIYYRNASCAILVFDVTNHESFEHLDGWVKSFMTIAGGRAFVFAVGNKIDLDERVVPETEMREWAEANGLKWFMISAKTGKGVAELFKAVAQELVDRTAPPAVPRQTADGRDARAKKNRCC
jgi:small GTP-binding protein